MSVATINIPSTVSTADTVRVSGKIDCEAVIEELDELLASISLNSGVVIEGAGCADEKPCVEPLEGTVAKSHGVKGVSEFNHSPSLTHPSWIPMCTEFAHLEPSEPDPSVEEPVPLHLRGFYPGPTRMVRHRYPGMSLSVWNQWGYPSDVPSAAPVAAAPVAITPLATTPVALSPKAKSWFPPGADPPPAPVAATARDLPRDLRGAGWPAPPERHPLSFLASVAKAGSALRDRSDRRHELRRDMGNHPLPFLASVAEAGSAFRGRSDRRHELYREVWSYCAFVSHSRSVWARPTLHYNYTCDWWTPGLGPNGRGFGLDA